MKIITSKCIIRTFEQTETDVHNLALAANNKNIWNNVRDYFPYPYTTDDAKDFIAFCLESEPETNFAIAVNDKIIGTIGMNLQTDIHRVGAEIGYWISENYWQQGILTATLQSFIPYIFATFPSIHYLYAGVLAYNKGSMRVLEKVGFQLEGISRKALIKNGNIYDEYRYSLVRE